MQDSDKFAAQAYDKLGNTVKAIDNAITLIEIDFDEYTQTIGDMFLKNKNYAVAKIREKIKNSESNETWKLILVELYRGTCDYDKAIKIINEFESEQGSDALFNEYRGDYYYEMGLNQKAISEYELALNDGNNNDSSLWSKIGTAYYAMGKYSEADEYFRKYIEENPLNEYGYILLGQNCEMSGDNDSALDLYNQAVDMEQENPISYFLRGKLYLKNGDKAKAAEDFNKEVELDTVCCSSSSRAFSLFYLGREKEAFEWMDATVATEPYKTGSWYNQACLYSLTGRHDEAVAALEKALQMGYCDFLHIGIDSDLDGIRDRDDFKNLISKYSAKLQEKISALMQEEEKTSQKSLITEIDFKRHRGGTFEIPCKVNGLELKMIFDTGASDVSISIVEANFMLKNNYLSKNDIKGTKYYMNANGEISEGTTIILKEIKVGDAVMKNVAASVVESQDAPLLLGQSVMERFGTITIDNINNKLIIKQ